MGPTRRGGSDNRTTEHYRHLGTVSTRRRGLLCLILKFSFLCIANRPLHPLDIHLGFEYLSFRSFVWLALAPSRLHDSTTFSTSACCCVRDFVDCSVDVLVGSGCRNVAVGVVLTTSLWTYVRLLNNNVGRRLVVKSRLKCGVCGCNVKST